MYEVNGMHREVKVYATSRREALEMVSRLTERSEYVEIMDR